MEDNPNVWKEYGEFDLETSLRSAKKFIEQHRDPKLEHIIIDDGERKRVNFLLSFSGLKKAQQAIGRIKKAVSEAGLPEPEFTITSFYTITYKRPKVGAPQVTPQVTP